MNRLATALFIVDIHRENIAVAEVKKLGIQLLLSLIQTQSFIVDFPIPANDDATRSIDKIIGLV